MRQERHSIDTVFALLLFAVFAVSSMLLVLAGIKVYGRAADQMRQTDAPVMLSYLTEKLRGSEGGSRVSLDGTDSLLIDETLDGKEYVTWIYVEEGALKECLMPQGRAPVAHAGTVIGKVQQFRIRQTEEGLLEIRITDDDGQTGIRYYRFP